MCKEPYFWMRKYLILILEKEPVFPFSMLRAKQGNYWYHFYNVFGMTTSNLFDYKPTFKGYVQGHEFDKLQHFLC